MTDVEQLRGRNQVEGEKSPRGMEGGHRPTEVPLGEAPPLVYFYSMARGYVKAQALQVWDFARSLDLAP